MRHVTSGPHFLYENLEFKLVAVTREGVVAEARPAYPQDHTQGPAIDYPVPADTYDNLPVYYNDYYQYEEEFLPVQPSESAHISDAVAEEGSGDVDQPLTTAAPSSSSILPTPDPYKRSFLLAMGACVFLSLVVFFLVGLLVLNQRRFREVVITKTAAFRARSNSLRGSFTRGRKPPSPKEYFVIDMESNWPVL